MSTPRAHRTPCAHAGHLERVLRRWWDAPSAVNGTWVQLESGATRILQNADTSAASQRKSVNKTVLLPEGGFDEFLEWVRGGPQRAAFAHAWSDAALRALIWEHGLLPLFGDDADTAERKIWVPQQCRPADTPPSAQEDAERHHVACAVLSRAVAASSTRRPTSAPRPE